MTVYATADDVAAIWRPLTTAEEGVVTARLAQASRIVTREVQRVTGVSVDGLILAGELTADDVKDVVVDMVYRLVSIPGFVRQESVTVDDGSRSFTYDASVSKGGLFLSDDELSLLTGGSSGAAFTVIPGDDPVGEVPLWWGG